MHMDVSTMCGQNEVPWNRPLARGTSEWSLKSHNCYYESANGECIAGERHAMSQEASVTQTAFRMTHQFRADRWGTSSGRRIQKQINKDEDTKTGRCKDSQTLEGLCFQLCTSISFKTTEGHVSTYQWKQINQTLLETPVSYSRTPSPMMLCTSRVTPLFLSVLVS